MKIEHIKPPNWDKIVERFPVKWNKGVIVTYGDKIYCDSDIGTQKEVHECVHIGQQKRVGVDKWWEKYLADPSFVFSQELEAYTAEVKWIRKQTKDKNQRFKAIRQVCLDFSSPMYGNVIDYENATKIFNLFQNQ